jgi:hypothetical protein
MKTLFRTFGWLFAAIALAIPCPAATYYVWTNSPANGPGTNWTTAFHSIQSAVNTATNGGDIVMVTNGTYLLDSEISVTNGITIRSVNGSAATVVNGGYPVQTNRCFLLGNSNAVLGGFTITNGCAGGGRDYQSGYGGGVYAVANALVQDCVIVGNSAILGGGVYGGIVSNCQIVGNAAVPGGGAGWSSLGNGGGVAYNQVYNSTLNHNSAGSAGGATFAGILQNCIVSSNNAMWGGGGAQDPTWFNCLIFGNSAGDGGGGGCGTFFNCTIVGNSAGSYGGGLDGWEGDAYVYNSIVYSNSAPDGANYKGGTFWNCGTTPDPGGTRNITNDPRFVDYKNGNYRLTSNSPCRNAGTNLDWMIDATDLDGKPRIMDKTVDMGAYESEPQGLTGTIHYVCQTSPSPTSPYLTWANAAHDIQSAVNTTTNGDTVLVMDGVYNTGARVTPGYNLSNRVVITNNILVKSANGPEATLIVGQGPVGDSAMRCAYLTNGAVLSGFTLTNGFTRMNSFLDLDVSGGGAFAAGGILTNCVITCCTAYGYDDVLHHTDGGGGGVYGGTLSYCTIYINSTTCAGGGAYGSTLDHCTISLNSAGWCGGAALCTLNYCTIIHNNASDQAGGASGGVLNWCMVASNTALQYGGGVQNATISNCIIKGNCTINSYQGGEAAGGAFYCRIFNCVISGNSGGGTSYTLILRDSTVVGNSGGSGGYAAYNGTLIVSNSIIYYNSPKNLDMGTLCDHCCTPDWVRGTYIHDEPGFVDYSNGDYHLSSSSACINAGNNAGVTQSTDLDGNPRIQASAVDIGAYESPYAPIDARAGVQGTISPAGRVGLLVSSNQTFTINVNPGFQGIRDVKIDGISSGPTNTYTFFNVTSNHTIEVLFYGYATTNGLEIAQMKGSESNASVLIWTGTNGLTYTLQKSPSLLPPAWSNVPPYTNVSGIGSIVITNDISIQTQMYYRLKAVENN